MPPEIACFEAQPQRSKGAIAAGNLRDRGAPQLVSQLRSVTPAHRQARVPAGEPATAAQRVDAAAAALNSRHRRRMQSLTQTGDPRAEFILGRDDELGR